MNPIHTNKISLIKTLLVDEIQYVSSGEEKRLFSQAKFIFSNDKTQNVFSLMLTTHCQKNTHRNV